MIDNLFDVLYVAKTGKIKPDASLTDNLYGKKFYDAHSGEITTATGNPVSIITNKAQNAISTLLSYSPKQSGSGDPSPTNIRPIEGWTEANLFGCGKNLCFSKIANSEIRTGGVIYESDTNDGYIAKVKAGVTYKISDEQNVTNFRYGFFENVPVIGATSYDASTLTRSTFQAPIDGYIYVRDAKENGKVQIELGTTATDYEPYTQGANNTISLGGTYYGFSVDVERGVLMVDTEYLTLDGTDENWTLSGTGDSRFLRLNLAQSGYVSQKGICDQYVRTSIRTDNTDVGFNIALSQDYYHLRFRPNGISEMSIDDWKTMLANQPVHVVIYKSTPLELPLTPQTVALLAGNNTIWTDGDSLSVTYKAKKA